VDGCLRANITKGKNIIVFVNDVSRYLSAYNFTEYGFSHWALPE
jgi:hypothetical protein